MKQKIIHYFDYKSPYAYLAQKATYQLHADTDYAVEWRPYTLDIPSYLGEAELDSSGKVIKQTRNDHQWRRVKYSYMDCRREANRSGLTIRGTRKIFDSSIVHIGFLYVKQNGDFRKYHDSVYEQFWKRELEIEDPNVIGSLLEKVGCDSSKFADYLAEEGRHELNQIQEHAESMGVFGVPSYLVGDELFWGAERIDRVREFVGLNTEMKV